MSNKYTAIVLSDEGGSAILYKLKETNTIGFKEFRSKSDAVFAYNIQKKLSKFKLAPKIYGKICKIKIDFEYPNLNTKWSEPTGWGFLTQIVKVSKKLSKNKIQELVDNIYKVTKLKFWDCHEYNIGVYRNKYLCIDTGKESFDMDCNAWGMENPGPKCHECNKYSCKCGWGF